MNTLRSLAVDIMFNTGASKLLEVNSAVDEVKSSAMEAAGNMNELSDSVEDAGKKSKGFLGMSKEFMALTGAGVALGGALMKTTRRADELNEGLRRVEVQTGVSAEEMREWIKSVTDATSDVDGYVRSMEELVRMGVSTKEEFQEILPVFDTFGTATGKDMVEGIRAMESVLSALDIEIVEAGEHIDTLTWLTTGTTVTMGDLGRTMRREQARIRELGLTFDEIAVALAALEAEGIKGPRAVMAFQSAIQNAEGDLQNFWRGLGVTADTLELQNDRLLESAGLTDALAEANAKSLTWWDELKHRLDMAMWSAGTFLEPIKDLGPLLMALGPITTGLGKGIGWMTKGFKLARTALIPLIATTWSWTAALLANPITWIVLLIVGLIAAIVALWKNWDTVTEWLFGMWEATKQKVSEIWGGIMDFLSGFWEKIKEAFNAGVEWVRDLFTGIWDWISNLFGNLASSAWEWGKGVVDGLVGGIKDMWDSAVDTVKNFANDIADGFKNFFGISSPSKLMMEYGGDITHGLQIGMEDDVPEIPVPEFSDSIQTSGERRSNVGNVTFSPKIDIHIQGDADAGDIRRTLEQYFPELMDDFFELLAVRMG